MGGSGVGSGLDLRTPADAPSVGVAVPGLDLTRRFLLGLAVITAVASTMTCLAVIRSDGGFEPRTPFWFAVAVIALAQLARVKVHLPADDAGGRADYVMVGWGEVATIIALCLVPPAWVPLAAGIGALLAHLDRLVSARPGQRLRVPYAMCALTIAATAAAAAASLLSGGATHQLKPDHLPILGLLVLCGLIYFAVSSLLAAAWVADSRGLTDTWRRVATGKGVMLPGNLAVGTAAAMVFQFDPRWLVALVPVFAILHRGYAYRARADERWERWEDNLIATTRELNHSDPRDVAAAAIRGAGRLFGATEVQIALRRESTTAGHEPQVWYGAGRHDNGAVVPVATPVHGRRVITRPLTVGDTTLGEMRLRLSRRHFDADTDLVFSTYAYAVANALSDAATRHNLEVMAARTAFDAVHDPLTGLINRSMLLARGDGELIQRPIGSPVALILLDVDSFREVNDTLSPSAGDELLQTIAARLAADVRDGEVLARLGGDEFALLLTRDSGLPDAALDRARAVAEVVAAPVDVAGVTIAITATIGMAFGRVGGHGGEGIGRVRGVDTTELIRRAGVAMRQARREGVPIGRYADIDLPRLPRGDRHTVLADLRDALATTGQLRVVVQPVVSLESGVPVGAEVLARWHHPTRGLLLPSDFLPAVENSELAGGFTRHVIDLALAMAADWGRRGIDLPVTVNLCPRCTLDPQLPAMVVDRLTAHAVSPGRLILEITEGVMVTDPEKVEYSVAALRAVGVQVSVGDFGAASASLELLTRCRVDEVKIDRTFVAAMTTSPEIAAIVTATTKIADALDIRVVAEAVELPEQRDALNSLGIRFAQGHLFYPPLGPAHATDLIARLST